jgi:ATP-binding protein involved in chromosome partitioning
MTTAHDPQIIDILTKIGGITPPMIQSVNIDENGHAIVVLEVDPAQGTKLEKIRQKAEKKVAKLPNVKKAQVILTAKKEASPPPTPPARDPHGMNKNPPVKVHARRIIVIASGKGGVGKSTVAANIAAGLANTEKLPTNLPTADKGQSESRALKVGLLDADIYGPSQPLMMGDEDYKPETDKDRKMIPVERYGVKTMSIGFLTEKEKALVWRGPMAQNAFYQMLRDVAWGTQDDPLDYLIIDMPPGTGDIQLTLAQKVSVDGAIIVTTPQDIALLDARRAVEMFTKTNVPILGLAENMGTHICENCGHEEHIFGENGGQDEAKRKGIPFLGSIPLAKNIRLNADSGKPIILAEPNSAPAKAFIDIVEKIIDDPA